MFQLYQSRTSKEKWTDHYKLAITENSEAGVKVPRSFQLLTETRDSYLMLGCLSVIPVRDLLKIDRTL